MILLRQTILFIFSLAVTNLFAQTGIDLSSKQIKKIDSVLKFFMSDQKVPGASLAIDYNHHLHQRSFGLIDVENNVRATPVSVYRLASVCKPITAVAVMQLVEQGKINLDSVIQKYVPSFPVKKYPLTIRELLGHVSGIRHYEGDEFDNTKIYKDLTEALSIFKDDSLLHKPFDQFTYSTYGYTLLGAAIESVSGMSYFNYIKTNILLTAQMKHTFVDDSTIIMNRARGYGRTPDGKIRNAHLMNSSYKIPGGGLVSTVGDMINFMNTLKKGKLIKLESFRMMTTSLKLSSGKETTYGLGWIIGLPGYPNAYWHGGVQQGSTTVIVMLPGLTFSLLCNMEDLGSAITNTAVQLVDVIEKKQ